MKISSAVSSLKYSGFFLHTRKRFEILAVITRSRPPGINYRRKLTCMIGQEHYATLRVQLYIGFVKNVTVSYDLLDRNFKILWLIL